MNTSERILVILNPAAKSEKASHLHARIEALSPRVAVRITNSAGDAEAMAEHAVDQGYKTIIAAGGDGTINEVVNGLAGRDVTFGMLPVGTMNVFSTELGIPQNNLQRAWEVIEQGYCREVDMGVANDEYFVQLAGAGLDAEVVKATTPDFKKALGPMSYLINLAQVAARKPPTIAITPFDGPRREGSFVLVGNGRYYGGPFVLFKEARLDDGLLDVLVFQNQGHLDLLRYMQAIAFGMHPELPDVEYFQTTGLRLESEDSVPAEVDGELSGSLPYSIRLAPTKLRVLAPAPDTIEG